MDHAELCPPIFQNQGSFRYALTLKRGRWTPLFGISDSSNSLSDCSKNVKKIYRLEHFIGNACPCKNRPLKFSWKMDCLHFFYTSQALYTMKENGLYFDRLPFFKSLRIFSVDTPKNTQTRNWNPQNWVLRYAWKFAHWIKQPNSFRIIAYIILFFFPHNLKTICLSASKFVML